VIGWDRGRPARKRAEGAQSFKSSRRIHFRASRSFAGGTPAVPANLLTALDQNGESPGASGVSFA
jgi:hypothetical protein